MATPKLKKNVNDDIPDEVSVYEEEVSTYHNTIEVDENGETDSFEMPAGYVDENDVLQKTFTLREMTGRDEEAISKSEVRQNSSKVISILLERCVTSIGTLTRKELGSEKWRNVIKSLLVGDQDYMLVKLRELSMGEEIEVNHVCPSCKESMKTFINISELEIKPFKGERNISFELKRGFVDSKGNSHTQGVMRLPNGFDREVLTPIARKNPAQANTLMLTRLCKFEDGILVTEDVMRDLTVRDREYLQNILNDNLFGIDLETEITCVNCGETFKGSLNATNFI